MLGQDYLPWWSRTPNPTGLSNIKDINKKSWEERSYKKK